jgi:hypothetical protein
MMATRSRPKAVANESKDKSDGFIHVFRSLKETYGTTSFDNDTVASEEVPGGGHHPK